jgi:hypothetical protein
MEMHVEVQELGYTRSRCGEEMATMPTSEESSHTTQSREGVGWRNNEASGSFPFWSSGYALDRGAFPTDFEAVLYPSASIFSPVQPALPEGDGDILLRMDMMKA